MPEKYKNKYRIKSTRLPGWDYRNRGMYFITICTQNRQHFFGDVVDGVMQLTDIGKLANQYWMEIPAHFPLVELGDFIVMPNHIHGILIIVDTLQCNVSTDDKTDDKNHQMSKISPKSGSISTMIRSYKSVVTKNARKIRADFGWQSRFHDHIIRNEKSFMNISRYIVNNPQKWHDDQFRNR